MCEMCRKDARRSLESSRRSFILAASAAGLLLANGAVAKETKAPPKPQNVLSPDAALKRLKEGNERYVAGVAKRHDFKHEREALVGGQNPFAAILSCADSRVAPELAFDQGPGELFVVRVAGNFVDDDGLASLEYGVKFLGVPLIMVLGHTNCGAVDATIKVVKDNAKLPGHLPGLVRAIKPAVEAAKKANTGNLLDEAIVENVRYNVGRLNKAKPIVSALVAERKVKVVGGRYDLATGKVSLV